jgi:hypothetical protein
MKKINRIKMIKVNLIKGINLYLVNKIDKIYLC